MTTSPAELMMLFERLLPVAASIALHAAPQSIDAQARVSGTVLSNSSRETIVGASVEIVERRLRTFSNENGTFTFESVPRGTYTLQVTRIGFTLERVEFSIVDTSAVVLAIDLTPLALRLGEIVVTPGHFGSGMLQLYFDIFNAYNRTNIVSYDHWARVDENGNVIVNRTNGSEMMPLLPSLGLRYEF